jgi:Tfp pilus assembly protein PilN
MALDLLQRPVQARRRRVQRRLLWTLAMTLLGTALAWVGVQARLQDLPVLEQQLAQAQAQVRQQAHEQQTRQDIRLELQKQAAQQTAQERLQQAQQEDAGVLQLVADLLPAGVVLERIVFERGRIEWQGQAPNPQVLHALQARLNRLGETPWALLRTEQLGAAAEASPAALRFVLLRQASAQVTP